MARYRTTLHLWVYSVNRNKVMEKFTLDLSKPGQVMTIDQAVNLRDYGLGIKEDRVFLEVFDTEQYDGWMPTVAGMQAVQRRLELTAPSKPVVVDPDDIPTPEQVHAYIVETLASIREGRPRPDERGLDPTDMPTESLEPPESSKPTPGNLGEILKEELPEYLKGLPEHAGGPDADIPF